MQTMQTRRRFLHSASLACAAGLVAAPRSVRAEPPPETTTVRLPKIFRAPCQAAEYVAVELLQAEGFTDIQFFEEPGVDSSIWIARGDIDFDYNFPPPNVLAIDAGVPIRVLAGMHSGCIEVIANDSVRSIADLKGRKVGVDDKTSYPHLLLKLAISYVGLDPDRDIEWIPGGETTSLQNFIDGRIDALAATAPEPQELRARKIGHTILSSLVDRPWSQYYCCMLTATADYIDAHPIATKRVLRALLKTADLCVANPEWAAQRMVDEGFTDQYEYALQTLQEIRFDVWREFDPEDSIRFYALRMKEVGMVKSDPKQIIANGTDWRFLDELKRELKA